LLLEVSKPQLVEDILAHYSNFTASDLIREITFVNSDPTKSSEQAKYPTRAHAELVNELWTQLVYGNKYFEVCALFLFFLGPHLTLSLNRTCRPSCTIAQSSSFRVGKLWTLTSSAS